MKTNETKRSRRARVCRVALWAALVAPLAGACGGSLAKVPSVGSESHFLEHCEGMCAGGLDCIAGICTRSCLTQQASCSDLAADATCTNQSVEPGEVAVCDVSCSAGAGCAALGAGYGCEGGYCRKALASSGGGGTGGSGMGIGGGVSTGTAGSSMGTGSGGSAGTGGSSATGADCNPVGRYEVGKEGGYKPCCPGLTQLQTLVQSYVNNESTPSCVSEPLNSFSCIQGSCGDGVCEDAEAPCGCGVDCPDSNWRAHPSECEGFRDQSPPPDIREISITNTGSVPLYIMPVLLDCAVPVSLVEVQRDGVNVDLQPPRECRTGCQQVIDEGWPFAPGAAGPSCPLQPCRPPSLIQIDAGQTRRQPVALENVPQQLQRACAQGIAADSVGCYQRTIPQPGNYSLTVRAVATPCDPREGACECQPDAEGTCTNPLSGPSTAPFVFTLPSTSYFQNQTIEISAPSN